MAVPLKTIRGLRNIRTRSLSPDQALIPYQAYTKITYLEIERHRVEVERANLTERLRTLEERLQRIDVEKEALLRRIGKPSNGKPRARPPRSVKPVSPLRSAGFKLRY